MASYATITIESTDENATRLADRFDRPDHGAAIKNVCDYIKALMGGQRRGIVRVQVASVAASKAITVSASGGAPADTLVIGGTTLTNAASPANENQFADAATDALLLANVVACINANTALQKMVYAVGDGVDTFTVYSKVAGTFGNRITLAETGSGFAIAGGATALTGGLSDEFDEFFCGVADPTE